MRRTTAGILRARRAPLLETLERRHLMAGWSPVGPESLVNDTTAGVQLTTADSHTAIAGDDSGHYVIAWSGNGSGDPDGIYARRYDASGALGGSFRVNTTIAGVQHEAAVAMDNAGNFVVVWSSNGTDGSGWGVYGQRYNAAGVALGAEFRVNVTTAGNQYQPSVAMDADGDFVVTWTSENTDGAGLGISARRYNAAGAAVGGVISVNAYTPGNQVLSRVAMDDAGAFTVVWQSDYVPTSSIGIFGQRFTAAGATIGTWFVVNTTTGGFQLAPAIGMNGSGAFVVAWTSDSQDGSGRGIFAQRYTAGGAKTGGEFLANTTTAGDQQYPSVGVDPAGAFVIAWESNGTDGSGFGVYAQEYTSAGASAGPEFRVSTTTAGSQQAPAGAMVGNGDYTIVWSGAGAGDADGVFRQRYEDLSPDVVVNPTSGLTTTRWGGTASFTVTLASRPTADVTINLSSSDPTEGTLSVPSLTFTRDNWSVPQTVTVTGIDDGAGEGSVAYSAVTSAAVSADPLYSGRAVADVAVVNLDNTGVSGGLRGTYYDTIDFTGPALSRLDPAVNFHWAAGSPDPAIGSDTFSARWTGEIQPRYGETYTFYTTSDDGIRLWVNGVLVIDNWTDHANTVDTGTITLAANQWYSIVLEMYENTGIATAKLEWSSASQSREVVPPTRLRAANAAPVAGDDSGTVVAGNVLNVPAPGVLSNDSDADGDAVVPSVLSGPSNGSVVLNANGSFSYTPDAGFSGTDSFTYTLDDGWGGLDTATVTITVTNAPPVVTTTGSTLTYTENAGAVAVDPGLAVSDANNTTLAGATVTILGYVAGQDVLAYSAGAPITANWDFGSGTLTLSGSATVAQYQAALRAVTYTNTSDNPSTTARTVRFVVSDGFASSAPADRAVAVSAVNDAPLATADTYDTDANVALTVGAAGGLLSNDTDAEGATLTATLLTGPTRGSAAVNADGSFTYTPNLGFFGTDQFVYRVSDGVGGTATATVTVQVAPPPPPGLVITPQSGLTTTEAGGTATFTVTLAGRPGANVTVALSSGDTSEGTISDASLTFSSNNWNTPQTVVVTGVDDSVVDGDVSYFIVTAPMVSNDPAYSGLNAPDVPITGADDAEEPPAIGTEFRVNTTTGDVQDRPATAMSPFGSYVVVWSSRNQDGNGRGIFAQRYGPGGVPLGGEFRVNQTTADNQDEPSVAMDANGNFVITWSSRNQDGSGKGVYARRFAANGTALGGEFLVNQTTADNQDQPAVAVAPDGHFVISWRSSKQDGSGGSIVARRYDAAGTALGAEFQVNTNVIDNQDQPAAAIAPDGRFVIAWKSNKTDGSGAGVFARLYGADGVPLGPDIQANTTVSANQDKPTVAMSASGAFVIAWASQDRDGDRKGVSAQRFAASGARLGGEFLVNTVTLDDQDVPSIGMSASGAFAIAWSSRGQDGSGKAVWVRHYAPDGTPLGSAQVNTTTVNNQDNPALAMNDAGDFIVAWQGNGAGDTSGVFGQLYARAGIVIVPASGPETTEAGGAVTFGVVLRTPPTANVVISVTTSDAGEGTPSVSTLTFTPANWNVVQSVTVTGVADGVLDGDAPYRIVLGPATSADARYDGLGTADVALVNHDIDVPPPVAVNDSYQVTGGQTLATDAATGVLANDLSNASQPLTATLLSQARFGTVSLAPDGSFTYTPAAGFAGTDSFTYAAGDPSGSTPAQVTIFVDVAPDPDPDPIPEPEPEPEDSEPVIVPPVQPPAKPPGDVLDEDSEDAPPVEEVPLLVAPAPPPAQQASPGAAGEALSRDVEPPKAAPAVRPLAAPAAAPAPLPARVAAARPGRQRTDDEQIEREDGDRTDDGGRPSTAGRWASAVETALEGRAVAAPLLTAAGPLASTINAMGRQIVNADHQHNVTIRTVSQVAMAMTAGYVMWSLRGASLLASLVTSMPLWRSLDPLPILEGRAEKTKRKRRRKNNRRDAADDGNDDDKLKSMVN